MGFYKDREDYVKGLAINHPLIQHNAVIDVNDPTRKRRSFFRINDEEELMSACTNWAHFPCLVMVGLMGSDVNKEGSYRQRNVNTWMILTKAVNPVNTNDIASAITSAYDISYTVMMDLKKTMLTEYELNGGCGNFKRLEHNAFKWEQVGPYNDNLFGWILSFIDETNPA